MTKKKVERFSDGELPDSVQDFRELFGREEDQTLLSSLIEARRLPPVLLLTGRPGIGKRTFAAWLVARIHCAVRTGCGECGPCQEWRLGAHPDGLWLAPKEGKHKLEAADQLSEHLSVMPSAADGARTVVLSNAEAMTTQCANRLLKTLEEPPPAALIVLTSSEPKRLLDTIRSRAVPYAFRPPAPEASLAWLEMQARSRGLAMDQSELARKLAAAGLSPGVARDRLDEASLAVSSFAGRVEGLEEILARADQLAKEVPLTDQGRLWAAVETELNAYYRVLWRQGRPLAEGFRAMTERRAKLAAIKRLAVGKQVPLNIRLSLEAIGLG